MTIGKILNWLAKVKAVPKALIDVEKAKVPAEIKIGMIFGKITYLIA
jgi:hypothetical protein